MKRMENFRSLAFAPLEAGFALGLALTTRAAEGQRAARINRVAYLQTGTRSEGLKNFDIFRQDLHVFFRRAAIYVDEVLKVAKLDDLLVEHRTSWCLTSRPPNRSA